MFTLGQLLEQSALKYPDKTFLFEGEKEIKYTEINERCKKIASGLYSMGIRKGDRVGVMFPNSVELVETYFALGLLGAIIVPLNVQYTENELEIILRHSESTTVITDNRYKDRVKAVSKKKELKNIIVHNNLKDKEDKNVYFYEDILKDSIEQLPIVEPEDVAIILYTSGTTGAPKGVMLTHFGLIENARVTSEAIGYTKNDRSLTLLPMYHSFGLSFDVLQMMFRGGSTVIMEKFDTSLALEMIEKYQITVIAGVPTMYSYLFNSPDVKKYNLNSLRLGDVGGGPVPNELKSKIEEQFNIIIIESYGLTEISPVATVERPNKNRREGSCGLVLSGMEARVVNKQGEHLPPGEVGELIIKSKTIMKGYWKDSEATNKVIRNGWLYTGDLARIDSDGYIYIVDRLKDLIISGGYNIYPKEIENVIYTYPGVLQVAVVGIEDDTRGEIVKAFIVPKKDVVLNEENIIKYCREKLANYKIPREIEIVRELPLTYNGKIQKYQLK